MLARSDTPVEQVATFFATHGVEAGYVVPTETGLNKSIIDAHEGIRRFLKAESVHDFQLQKQGRDHRRVVPVKVVMPDALLDREMSLYRPISKNGDPRMWIGKLGDYASPFNLIALIVDHIGQIHVVNCSRSDVWNSRNQPESPLMRLLQSSTRSDIADELLNKLTAISEMGFIDSMRAGPTGVGFTLETLLGIKANSDRAPDYKGIEIKSGRMPATGEARTRSTLFSQVPKWEISHLKSGKEILHSYGYVNASKNRTQLYCSVSATPNSQGLFIRISPSGELVENLAVQIDGSVSQVVVWVLDELEAALSAKHKETFWVKAKQRTVGVKEQFHFTSVVHTRRPLVKNFGLLVDTGKIEFDYTLSSKSSGGTRDHGYLFKIWPKNFDLLFPPAINYKLST